MNASFPRPQQHLALAELDRVILEPVLSPMPTVVEAIRDLISDRPPTVLTGWQRKGLRRAMRGRGARALAAFRPPAAPSPGGPNQLMYASAGASMLEELDRLAATEPNELGIAIELATDTGRPTEPWLVVHRDPSTWLQDYLAAARLVWTEVEPLWMSASGWLDREVERLQVASERGAASEVVNQLGILGRVEGGDLVLRSHTQDSGRLRVGGALQLVPVLAAPPAGGWGDDYADVVISVRYALAPRTQHPSPDAAAPESLEALVGVPRAAILLALDTPKRPGELAEQLYYAPSGVTHHLVALDAAGLVTRTRQGRHFIVRRTARATALLALYDRA
jgi:DNA-binding transcriptional ArsR family regulator